MIAFTTIDYFIAMKIAGMEHGRARRLLDVDNPMFISLCIHLIAGPVNRALVANATAADAGGRLSGIRCSDTVLALQWRCLLCVPLV